MSETYFDQRLQRLGITEELNKIKLLQYDAASQQNILKEEPIFRRHERGIEIIVYTLQRETIRIEKDGGRWKKAWSIIRLEKPIVKENGDLMKYLMPKGAGSYPFFPPQLLDKYDSRQEIKTLYLTEGFFKAFKGAMLGIDIIGLPSITHLRDKATGTLHPEILQLMRRCGTKRVVWLTDGDCNDLSRKALDTKEKVDLYRRPMNFFTSISTFKQLLEDHDVDKYFMHVNTDGILQENNNVKRDDVKGLDDILVAFPDKSTEIIEDINSISRPGFWFYKTNISNGLSKVREYFRLNNVTNFYLFHLERKELSRNSEFIFNGTKYQYDENNGECKVLVPGEASNYFRVADEYFKFIKKPNKYKQLETVFDSRQKGTITDDHGKHFFKHIPKYEAFCNVPDHVNYQQVIHNCFNVYNPLDFSASTDDCTEEDCPTILKLITHIFGTNLIHFTHPKTKERKEVAAVDLALDYIQILYQRPWEKLPILCLVSKENNTGKSTFGNLLQQMFGGNCSIVGNSDIAGDFNKHWSTKTIVIVDETKIDKQAVVEKVKMLSTAEKIVMNAKGRDHVEIDCFIKFIFISNNEENFINVHDEDVRYWIIKVPVIREVNPTMMDNLIEEIPAFMSFLNRRRLSTEKLYRMWFLPDLLKTEALKKVQQYSKPAVEKELLQYIRDVFFDFGVKEFLMTKIAIRNEVFKGKYDLPYIERILKENLKVEPYWEPDPSGAKDMFGEPIKVYKNKRHSYPKWEVIKEGLGKTKTEMVEVTDNGRPYFFRREQFLTPEEIAALSVDPEMKYLSDMTPGNGLPTANKQPNPKDDLPF